MMKVVIIDDEKHALDALEDVLLEADSNQIQIIGKFTNPFEALKQMQQMDYDVVFLDIEMPGIKGLEVAEKIVEQHPATDIIFVTAYDQYAVDAFEVNALDYLLKPIRQGRMMKTIEKLKMKKIAQPSNKNHTVQISCFGQFQVKLDQGDCVKWRTHKVSELLAYLLHHKDEDIHKEKILQDLWPHMDEERSIPYLHTCIYQLRKTIKKYELQDHMNVTYINGRYSLKLKDISNDVEEFLAIVNGNRTKIDSIEAWEKAISLYRGHYFEEDDFPWAVTYEQQLFLMYQGVFKSVVEHYLKANKFEEVTSHLLTFLDNNPFHEEFHEFLLQAYAQMGNRPALIEHFEKLELQFREELNIEVSSSLKNTFEHLIKRNEGS